MSRSHNAGTGNFTAIAALPKARFYGYAARNIGDTPATIVITHGAAGPVLATFNLAPKAMTQGWPEPGGTSTPNGIFVERTGTVQISIFMRG